MRFGAKITLTLAVIASLLLSFAYLSYADASDLAAGIQSIRSQTLLLEESVQGMAASNLQLRLTILSLPASPARDQDLRHALNALDGFQAALARANQLVRQKGDPSMASLLPYLQELERMERTLQRDWYQLDALERSHSPSATVFADREIRPLLVTGIDSTLAQLNQAIHVAHEEQARALNEQISSTRRRNLLLAGVLLALVGAIAWIARRQVIRPLKEMELAAKAYQTDGTPRRFQNSRRDELGALAEAFNNLLEAQQAGLKQRLELERRSDEALRREASFAAALNQTTLDLLEQRDRTAMLNILAERAARLLDVTRAEVALVEGEYLIVQAATGPGLPPGTERSSRSEAVLSFRAFDTRQPVAVADYSNLPEANQVYRGQAYRAVAVLPIMHADSCLGVLGLLRRQPDRPFTTEDLEKGRLFAQLATLVIHNVTLFEKAVREARENEESARQVIATAFDAIVSVDTAGRITAWNPQAEVVFGWPAAEAIGRDLAETVIPAEHREKPDHGFRQLVAEGENGTLNRRMEITAMRRSGAVFPAELTIARVVVRGQPQFSAFIRDITERRRAETLIKQQLRHLNTMARISSAVSGSDEVDELLRKVLDVVLDIFGADRACFLYPCDPDAPFWEVPVERTRPEWPGVFALGQPMPTVPDVAAVFREALAGNAVMQYGPGAERAVPTSVAEGFSIKSQVLRVMHPKLGRPWLFGLQHCTEARLHSDEDLRLVEDICQRVSEALTRLVSIKNLRESEERFRSVFGRSPMPIICATLEDGRIVEANAAAEATFGYRREELIGRTPEELDTWANPADRQRFVARLRAEGTVTGFEARMRRKDGSGFDALCFGNTLTIDGQACSLKAVRDVTESKRAQAVIMRNETRLREAQHLALIGEWEHDFGTGTLLFGEMTSRIFEIEGQRTGDVYGAFQDRIHPEDRERVSRAYEQAVATRTPYEAEHRLQFPDGRIKHVVERGMPEYDADGKPRRTVGTTQDITARKLSEEAARQSDRQLRELFEFAPDAIVMCDAAGRIVQANLRAEQLFGYARSELIGQGIEILVPESQRWAHQRHRGHFTEAPAQRAMGQRNVPLSARRKDGSTFPAEISLGPIHSASGLLVAAAVRDITERRAAEELKRQTELRLRQAQKLESLGTLAGGIAHDFNNILTGLLGFVEVARGDLPEGHPARFWVEQIGASGQRAKLLVRQILTFSRKHEGDLAPLRLQDVIREALNLLGSTLPAMVRIEEQLQPDCPPAMANATQIHQVVMNLCTNAWHALPPEGGRIIVRLEACEIGPDQAAGLLDLTPGPAVRLSIRDTGSGMDAATLEHIFEPFFTTKAPGQGTGLGLAVVHGIIRSHHGAIQVQSSPGAGTTFEIYLPALRSVEASSPATKAERTAPQGRGERILLIDDDPIGSEALKHMLLRLGYQVTLHHDPLAAREAFRNDPGSFDLAITDFALPGLPGNLLARDLLAVRPDLPIILISGYIEAAQLQELQRSGLREILRKPPSLLELGEAVARHRPARS